MKKFSIFFTCFALLWWIAGGYIEFKYDPHTAYWLAFQLFGRLLLIGTILFNAICRKEEGKWSILFGMCCWTLIMFYWGNKDVAKYKDNVCMDKFGKAFNEIRKNRGIPIIPAGWHERYSNHGRANWESEEHVIGHTEKYIDVDDGCVLNFEDDDYTLKPTRGIKQFLYIRTQYAKGKGSDTISYRYAVGDSSRTITPVTGR